MDGFARGRNLKKLGLESQDTAELFFDDVKVPKENLQGPADKGFRIMMKNLAEERLQGAVGFCARAERAFEITLEFITGRRAFGQNVGAFQNSRFKMASMRTQIDAALALTDHCAREHLGGR
ncbi:acyl-CoA dehydrogenase family protein [Tropicibacter naphthalenivorans]|uniref:Acyl-CoA dehydrogenase n=1 Tax=Tropicibacter naphthalenivorans TaxID=441103 RepID=A0A0P1GGZ6_9RHOB|nr:acyl-CoA dehydrogenase family protein [Tropicibacter naphthalenivorans]CUH81183.1 Acyl-CoA dehydrogenase [Tropicibacter naphthalenivorans]SMC97568.1 Acyl-CoA dehydrogenase, C-terminal domain [Tropicibacter naphthalenivorans]